MSAACSDGTGPGSACEVIYATSQSDLDATTGIQVCTRLVGAAVRRSVQVESGARTRLRVTPGTFD